jgi:hypothetical protein
VGTTNTYGLPLYAPQWPGLLVYDNTPPAPLLAATVPTFVAGVTTTASASTGDVRGTIVAPNAADGTIKFTVYQPVPFAMIASTYQTALNSLVGVPQF